MLVFNTSTNKKEEFVSIEPKKIKMYICGPTVYNYFHIGNARPFLFFDVVRNFFKYQGFDVLYIQNITDIDDKIIKHANDEEIEYFDFTKRYIEAFFEDLEKLHISKADENPKATDFISEMVSYINELILNDYAYEKEGDVYFSVRKLPEYGQLSGKNIDDLLTGARIEANDNKKDATDFTLWKKAKVGEPSWDSPWGKGRPGWHTECVVMSKKYLGTPFDIHGGGIDLIFPHHENELAQALAVEKKPLANYWMHNGFLNIEGDKMSKSLNNFFTARDVLKLYSADTVRFFFLSKHYRSPIDYNPQILEESKSSIQRFHEVFKKFPVYVEPNYVYNNELVISKKSLFTEAMNDDFNTAKAVSYMFDLVKLANQGCLESANLIYELGCILGFFRDIKSDLSNSLDDKSDKLISLLIEIRNQAKRDKNFVLSDKIRNDLKDLNIELRDTVNGTEWSVLK